MENNINHDLITNQHSYNCLILNEAFYDEDKKPFQYLEYNKNNHDIETIAYGEIEHTKQEYLIARLNDTINDHNFNDGIQKIQNNIFIIAFKGIIFKNENQISISNDDIKNKLILSKGYNNGFNKKKIINQNMHRQYFPRSILTSILDNVDNKLVLTGHSIGGVVASAIFSDLINYKVEYKERLECIVYSTPEIKFENEILKKVKMVYLRNDPIYDGLHVSFTQTNSDKGARYINATEIKSKKCGNFLYNFKIFLKLFNTKKNEIDIFHDFKNDLKVDYKEKYYKIKEFGNGFIPKIQKLKIIIQENNEGEIKITGENLTYIKTIDFNYEFMLSNHFYISNNSIIINFLNIEPNQIKNQIKSITLHSFFNDIKVINELILSSIKRKPLKDIYKFVNKSSYNREINILVVGRSSVGKSLIVDSIVQNCDSPQKIILGNIEIKEYIDNNIKYRYIEFPGLNQTYTDISPHDIVIQELEKFKSSYNIGVSIILFVMDVRISKEVLSNYITINNLFGSVPIISIVSNVNTDHKQWLEKNQGVFKRLKINSKILPISILYDKINDISIQKIKELVHGESLPFPLKF